MNIRKITASALVAALPLLTACDQQGSAALPAAAAPSTQQASRSVQALEKTDGSTYTCPVAETSSGKLDCTKLPLGDHKYLTTGAKRGYVYSCMALSGAPIVASAPWLGSSTWNVTKKIAVQGAHLWPGSITSSVGGSTRTVVGNGLPSHPHETGTFPIAASDPAYQYDRNPNSIAAQNDDFALAANPVQASQPSCLSGGAIGITLTGVAIYDAFDAAGYDAVAGEVQDLCHGHPDQASEYHYHGYLQACVPDAGSAKQNSSLLGYALDGFGIYGPWYNGKVLTSADLDECHGITSVVNWNGKNVSMYHYVSTYDFPYTLGCYRGTPVQVQTGPPDDVDDVF
jgi:hypothetical protein